ncbi:KpsF/GutQ family sugar-phosphate isomerase [bacterium]|nr:KpsF/GutQ family sugar-phosphate isomerase [bacterium]
MQGSPGPLPGCTRLDAVYGLALLARILRIERRGSRTGRREPSAGRDAESRLVSTPEETLDYARKVIEHEAKAVRALIERIDANFEQAAKLLLHCKGRIVVTGMGKPWLVGQKISATLASTGSPSLALNAAEAVHGDLGRICADDVVLIMTKSGETSEIVRLLDPIKKIGAKILAITSGNGSTVARAADVVLKIGDVDEAWMGLAPTTSTTAMLVLGDALALAVLKLRNFDPERYAQFHPGGSLGRKLMKVEEIMRRGPRCPTIEETRPVSEALLAISEARAGAIIVVDGRGRLAGIFTDGDLRRHAHEANVLAVPISSVMTRSPMTIAPDRLASEAARILREKKIDELPVIDRDGRPVGMIDIQDILASGLA